MLEFYRPKCDVLECLLPLAEDLCEREEEHKSARVFIDGVAFRVEVTESMWNKSLAMIHVYICVRRYEPLMRELVEKVGTEEILRTLS